MNEMEYFIIHLRQPNIQNGRNLQLCLDGFPILRAG